MGKTNEENVKTDSKKPTSLGRSRTNRTIMDKDSPPPRPRRPEDNKTA